MALNFSGKVDSDYELIEKGDYEVTLNCEYKKTNAGTLYINCKFAIRKDVEQSFGGRYIFDAIYKTQGTDDFNKTKINAILAAIPNAKLDFADYDELVQYLTVLSFVGHLLYAHQSIVNIFPQIKTDILDCHIHY